MRLRLFDAYGPHALMLSLESQLCRGFLTSSDGRHLNVGHVGAVRRKDHDDEDCQHAV